MKSQGSTAEIELPIGGMTCAACARTVEKQLGSSAGVEEANVNFATRTATVRYFPDRTHVDDLVAAVENAGFEVPREPPEEAEARERRNLLQRVAVGALFALPVFVLAMLERAAAIQMILTLPVFAFAGWPFFADAWGALRRRSANMNTLVVLGTGAAFLYSTWALFTGGTDVYFEAAAVVIVLVLLGRYLEARARGRASGAIRRLIALQPSTARVLRDGVEVEVPAAMIERGELLLLRPGERVAVDGVIREGASEIDESMLTGESLPAAKVTGAKVYAGTINGTGALTYEATRVGRNTALARIVELVKKAQGSKAPSARLADTVSGYFTFGVMAAALLTFIVWFSIGPAGPAVVRAVAVLIIACPCAMGLATPVAIMAGTGRGAERGILFRSGAALEAAARIDTVVFDKTGTLTSGRHRVSESTVSAEVLLMAAAVERLSEHPVARAIVSFAGGAQLPGVSSFRAIPGSGAQGIVSGRNVFVGRGEHGEVRVEIDGKLHGTFQIADSVKPDSAAAVRRLREAGFAVWMITGDHTETARRVADEIGLARENVLAEVLPADKDASVARLRSQGRRVAMVGDGINDAPALARADVGIAIGTGTDVAIESAGVVLTSGNPEGVPEALFLARRTLRIVRQNLFWAFAYNAAGIPIAAGLMAPWTGWTLSPMLASAAMALSSVSVVMNSLRLAR